MAPRPTVSVIVPFAGTDAQLDLVVSGLERLARQPGDELIVADNRPGAQARRLSESVRGHPASAVASPGFARNRGAAAAHGDWLVFIDADTDPAPDLLDAYFEPPPASGTAVLAGGIDDCAGSDDAGRSRDSEGQGDHGHSSAASVVARHAVARGHMSQTVTLGRAEHPYAQSANLAVRRTALVRAGGFAEHARAGEDADLCFRLAAAGLALESRPAARVRHQARQDLGGLLAQLIRHGAGAGWCNRRHPGSFPRPTVSELLRRGGHSLVLALGAVLRGDREGATFALLEIAEMLAFELGRVIPNQPRWRPRP